MSIYLEGYRKGLSPNAVPWIASSRRLLEYFPKRYNRMWELFLSDSRGMVGHLHRTKITNDEVGSKMIKRFIETVKQGPIMNAFKFKISPTCRWHRCSEIINFLMEFINNLIRNDCLQSINNSIFILLRTILRFIPMKQGETPIDVVAVWRIDQV